MRILPRCIGMAGAMASAGIRACHPEKWHSRKRRHKTQTPRVFRWEWDLDSNHPAAAVPLMFGSLTDISSPRSSPTFPFYHIQPCSSPSPCLSLFSSPCHSLPSPQIGSVGLITHAVATASPAGVRNLSGARILDPARIACRTVKAGPPVEGTCIGDRQALTLSPFTLLLL